MESNRCKDCNYHLGNGWCKFPICVKDDETEESSDEEKNGIKNEKGVCYNVEGHIR